LTGANRWPNAVFWRRITRWLKAPLADKPFDNMLSYHLLMVLVVASLTLNLDFHRSLQFAEPGTSRRACASAIESHT
jgi:hypothetical protein